MIRPQPEVAEVIRSCYDEFLERYGKGLTPEQRRTIDDLARCRTAALGGHVLECPQCGHRQISYNSCGNRHCPKCQATASARWLEAQAADLLPVPYFHVVFTLPSDLGPIALHNPRRVYGLLMQAAAETLIELAADPKHLGAKVGVLMTLHTWGQKLDLHPHVHCVVTGGGLSLDESHWVVGSDHFFLPERVLGRVFRGKFLAGLHTAFRRGKLRFPGKLAAWPTQDSSTICCRNRANQLGRVCQATMGRTRDCLELPGSYTHKTAISNRRLLSLEDGQVAFRWKDYAQDSPADHDARRHRVRPPVSHARAPLRLRADPPLRHPGQLSSPREAHAGSGVVGGHPDDRLGPADSNSPPERESPVTPTQVCPLCGAGRIIVIEEFPPLTMAPVPLAQPDRCFTCDDS